jgi:hypothetical protein
MKSYFNVAEAFQRGIEKVTQPHKEEKVSYCLRIYPAIHVDVPEAMKREMDDFQRRMTSLDPERVLNRLEGQRHQLHWRFAISTRKSKSSKPVAVATALDRTAGTRRVPLTVIHSHGSLERATQMQIDQIAISSVDWTVSNPKWRINGGARF